MAKHIGSIMMWGIGYKIVLLMYVFASAVTSNISISPWFILSILLYLSLNILLNIVQPHRAKQSLAAMSIFLVIVSSLYVDQQLILLLPMSLYEIVNGIRIRIRTWTSLVLVLIPLAFIDKDLQILYACLSMTSFILYTNIRTSRHRIAAYQDDMERMREDIKRLTRSLNDNRAYLLQSEYTSKLEERNRMSQEIHDKIGHAMTGALIQMEASKRMLQVHSDQAAELLNNAIQISKDGIEDIRHVLKETKPPLEQLGINRLKLLIDAFSVTHSIQTVLTYKGNVDAITPLQWKIIMENTQEAMTNAVKYSECSKLSIDILVLDTVIKAEVADNGNGAKQVVKGLGILGMEERTASVSGKIIVDGSRGFSVTTLLPTTSV
ncbi:MAG: sensor histidine kinase [Bacillota bacterium]